MCRLALALLCSACASAAEVRTLTLREAVELALKQSPDVALARLDEQKAEQAVRLAKDPFIPKVVVGSGLAYSNGFPMSIEGATPSIFQARAIADVFNRPQNYRIASVKEARRGAVIDAAAKQDEVVYRAAALYLDAEKAAKVLDVAQGDVKGLEGVLESVRARVAEGRELPIEVKKAELNLARARYRSQVMESNLRAAQTALAQVLGLGDNEQVRAAQAERPQPPIPDSADAAVKTALAGSKEIRSLESKMLARGFDVRAERSGRLPKLDLVAQYGLLARFNNYDVFFQRFQRHNGQLGISLQIPLWSGPGIDAAARQDEADAAQLRIQIRNARSRIESDTRKAYEDIAQAGTAQDIARLDLELARDNVSILLAQMQEGRVPLRQVEEARGAETDKWIAFYDAAENVEKARLNLLRLTGELTAALR